MLSAHVLSLETPFASQQIGKLSRYSDSDWFTYCITYDCWHLAIFAILPYWWLLLLSLQYLIQWVMLWKWQYIFITQPLSCFLFHLPNLLLTQNFVYPTLFSSVPPPAINNDRSLIAWLFGRLVIKWPLTLGRFAEFPRASPSEIPQTCLGLRGHLITNLPQVMLLLIISDVQNIWSAVNNVLVPGIF
jgi:hypothetical protein